MSTKALSLMFFSAIALAMLAALAGCGTGPKFDARGPAAAFATTAEGEPVKTDISLASLQSATNLFTVGPGDVLELEILGSPASQAAVTVGPDGKIYFQFLPGLDVWGLTISEMKSLIESELAKYRADAPRVGVSLLSVGSKYIWMLGRVAKPGIYPITGPMTIVEAVSMAGGSARTGQTGALDYQADLSHSFVKRGGQILPVDFEKLLLEGDMSQNIYLQPDDFVYLPSSTLHEVMVLGAVRAPRAVPYNSRMTLVSAITAALGTAQDAYVSHVAIVRGSLTEPKVAVIDYGDILSGKAQDVRLEPHDIVYVPFEPYRAIKEYARVIVTTFVNTIAANEGANAVIQNGNKVGISVSPAGQ